MDLHSFLLSLTLYLSHLIIFTKFLRKFHSVFCCKECYAIFADYNALLRHRINDHRKGLDFIEQRKREKIKKLKAKKKAKQSEAALKKVFVCEHKGCNKLFDRKS